jgi:hypothetical protein
LGSINAGKVREYYDPESAVGLADLWICRFCLVSVCKEEQAGKMQRLLDEKQLFLRLFSSGDGSFFRETTKQTKSVLLRRTEQPCAVPFFVENGSLS